jgi:hypothetical protein
MPLRDQFQRYRSSKPIPRFFRKTDIFFLEASEPMMLHLILDIGNRFRNMRDTDRERSVTSLPGRLREGAKVSCAQAEDPPLIAHRFSDRHSSR